MVHFYGTLIIYKLPYKTGTKKVSLKNGWSFSDKGKKGVGVGLGSKCSLILGGNGSLGPK